MYRRLTYFLEDCLGRLQLSELPLRGVKRVDLFHRSTVDHLALFLEQIFSLYPGIVVRVASHRTLAEIRAEYPDIDDFQHEYGVKFHRLEDLTTEPQAEATLLLYSMKGQPAAEAFHRFRLAFALSRAPRKAIILGDGSLWRGDAPARLARRVLRPLIGWLAPRRDREEWLSLNERFTDEPGEANSPCRVLFTVPMLIEQCPETGTVLKTGLFTRAASDDTQLYENGYHFRYFFDERQNWADRLNTFQRYRWRNMQAVGVARPAESGERPSAMDLGCGTGILADKLAREGFSAFGVDVSRTAIAKARAEFPRARFEVCDLNDLSPIQQQFNLITLSHVLEHMRDDAEFLRSVKRLLAPGGCVYIEVPWLARQTLAARPHWYRQLDHYREYSKPGLARLVETSGYIILAHADSFQLEGEEPFQFILAKSNV